MHYLLAQSGKDYKKNLQSNLVFKTYLWGPCRSFKKRVDWYTSLRFGWFCKKGIVTGCQYSLFKSSTPRQIKYELYVNIVEFGVVGLKFGYRSLGDNEGSGCLKSITSDDTILPNDAGRSLHLWIYSKNVFTAFQINVWAW